ncbi:thioredoxin family protein [Pedobacter sp. SD-b]|uniref:Thioredoxin family protein n=1 Tax=Pedobacter segetis TaxID=2793069 RepID=A0ABS1BHH0_9SPHI|nr:thioredoxin family protein [Pedobacter segetis]MBK0382304.1 thioredoxin family protein [Pedobacter segetis]
MKIKQIIIALLFTVSTTALMAQAQAAKPTLYHPEADAKKEIANAVLQAKKEGKNVFIQVGGNWCVWCLRFNKLVTETPELTKLMDDNYVVVHVNYSKENKNEDVLASLGYPQRFGFPVFVILDAHGKRLNTQNSAYLEDGKGGHSEKLVSEFLQSWTPKAIDPETYVK